MTAFTPVTSLIGGLLIGLSAVTLMAFNGRIAGVAGILRRLLPPYDGSALMEPFVFAAGLVIAPLLVSLAAPQIVTAAVSPNLLLMVAAGLLVGVGTALANGCTSGHGVCGISRLSVRSFVATGVFMAVAIVTVFVVRHLLGG